MSQPPPLPSPPPLAYGSPAHDDRRPLFSLRIALPYWVFLTAWLLFFLLAVPKFELIFRDFKMELPWFTKLVLAVSRELTGTYRWLLTVPLLAALPLAVPLLLGVGTATEKTYRRRERVAMWLVLLLAGVGIVVTFIALFAPMIALLDSVSGAGSKR